MIRIILSGCNGKMGQVITRLALDKIVAGIDLKDNVETNNYPYFPSIDECDIEADVIVDFSHPSSVPGLLQYALEKKMPLVISTTGLSNQQEHLLKQAASDIPVFHSANMSVGVNLLIDLSVKSASFFGDSSDIEIIEKHHNQKIDAPSGTAMTIANAISETFNAPKEFTYDRHSMRKKRGHNEIGIHAVRGGTIVGEHTVIFAGHDEIIEITHKAMSREIFAVGAIKAAEFLYNKSAGFYNMEDLVKGM